MTFTLTITIPFIATTGLVVFGIWFCCIGVMNLFDRYL